MRVAIVYELETACGSRLRRMVVAKDNEELTEYIRRLVKAQYAVIEVAVENE